MKRKKKKRNILFIFDFDGVIVDSTELLFEVYMDFLGMFGISGSKKEFNFLNGPKIPEIVRYLKKRYFLLGEITELIEMYYRKISKAYDKVKLNSEIVEILKILKSNSIKIALASSSKGKEIEKVLLKFNLKKYFDFIVSSDTIKNAKLSPEIFNVVKAKIKDYEYYVIEDSENGLLAAKSAGMNTIFYNPFNHQTNVKVFYEIKKLCELKNILKEIKLNCFTFFKSNSITLKLVEYNYSIASEVLKKIDELFCQERKKREIFNGEIISYKSHYKHQNSWIVECFLCEYKYFIAWLSDSKLAFEIKPIGVSGIVLDETGQTLIGKRCGVTEYEGYYEFIPAGGVSSEKRKNNKINFVEQLIEEFEEETFIKKCRIKSIEPFCFIYDKNHDVYDVCCKICIRKCFRLNTLL